MKTVRYIGMALIAMVLCVGLASCSDDDEDGDKIYTNEELVGTSWRGTFEGASITVKFESVTNVSIRAEFEGQMVSYDSSYTYDKTTGEFETTYGVDELTGRIKGKTMTFVLWDKKGTLTKR